MAFSKKKRVRRPTRKSSGGGTVLKVIAIILCVVIIGGVLVGSQMILATGKIDERTLCHTNADLNVTVVLLDLTDPLSATQQTNLKGLLAREIEQSATDTLISLGVVSEAPERWGSQFAKCRPVTGAEANVLYQNPRQIAERYDSEFRLPLAAALDAMLRAEVESQSPIMEALQALIASTPEFAASQGNRKVIMVSDMLQHSETLSFYRGQDWGYFSETGGVQRLAGNLSDVSVMVVRIPRTGAQAPSGDVVDDFWVRYLDRQGSRLPVVQILGDL